MQTENLLVLVDGSGYLFRAFHGLPKLSSRAGEPTGAIKGVISMLQKLSQEYRPSHIAVVFDAPGPTFRHTLYTEYKSHRPPIDEELRVQIAPLLQLIKAMGYPVLQISGVEADDVIGTLAHRASEAHLPVLISSGDKDLAQLVDSNVQLLDTMKMVLTQPHTIAERFKVEQLRADQVVDFLALVGDTADNIPGIPKVGPKTAAKWLADYDNIDNLLANQAKITGKVGENLREYASQLPLGKQLTQIKLDVDLPDVDLAKLSMNPLDGEVIASLCQRFDLHQLQNSLLGEAPANTPVLTTDAPTVATQYQLILTPTELTAAVDELLLAERVSFCVLTEDELYTQATLQGLAFAYQQTHDNTTQVQAFYLPLTHQSETVLSIAATHSELQRFLSDESVTKLTHNGKFAQHVLARYRLEINGLTDDVMLESYCYQSTQTNHSLEESCDYYLQQSLKSQSMILGRGAKAQSLDGVDLSVLSQFACTRADFIGRLDAYLRLRVESTAGINRVYRQIEMPLLPVLQQIESHGIIVDTAELKQQSQRLEQQLGELEDQAHALVGETFNLASPKQLQDILFSQLALPVIKKTPKGQPSTDEEVLSELANQHELPKLLLQHRTLSKLKTTYLDKIPPMITSATGRLHTSYHQAVASTGRLSSSDPNLQNIPIRSAEGRKIRRAFVAAKGWKILACDYSQIELRIMAHLSKDASLLQAFNQGQDVHRQTAGQIFAIDESAVTSDQRRAAKAINFGLIYGMSAFGLAKQIQVSRSEAAQYIETYFARYPGVKDYMQSVVEYAKGLGYVETLWGRRLAVADITSSNAIRRNAAERLSINAPMQGSAADIIKLAMLSVSDYVARRTQSVGESDIRLLMQVHDELVFEVKDSVIETVKPDLIACMQNVAQLAVPLIVDAGVGDNWDEAH